MQVVVVADAEEAGSYVAGRILERLDRQDLRVLGVATGSSPLSTYAALRDSGAGDRERLRGLTVFALDEYVGLPHEHPESYHAVIDREVATPLGLDRDRVHVPDGGAADLAAACRGYEEAITAAGGVDLQILGIGRTGHIGFNEPTSSFASRTRVATLAPRTRADNARFFPDPAEVPLRCVTQGLGTIMEARSVVLVALGTAKAAAVAATVEGPMTAMCPGSVLQGHPDATIVVDEAAAGLLAQRDYYDYLQREDHVGAR
jgi:glucosamine-6-phosphate deaminase